MLIILKYNKNCIEPKKLKNLLNDIYSEPFNKENQIELLKNLIPYRKTFKDLDNTKIVIYDSLSFDNEKNKTKYEETVIKIFI